MIDLTITVTSLLAVCAIVSPIFTSIINNRYQLKLKKLELEYQEKTDTNIHIRNIFECYLKSVGRCIEISDSPSLKEYGEFYFSALMYAPPDIQSKMISINVFMQSQEYSNATKLLEQLTPKILELINTM